MEDYAHKVSRLTAYLIKQRIKPKAPLYCVDGSEKKLWWWWWWYRFALRRRKRRRRKMEEFKREMKEVIRQKLVNQSPDGRYCIGCDDSTFGHTCSTSMVEKIDREFNRAFFHYMARNDTQVETKLRLALLIELLADEMPRERAVEKAKEILPHNYTTFGGGSTRISSTTAEIGDLQ